MATSLLSVQSRGAQVLPGSRGFFRSALLAGFVLISALSAVAANRTLTIFAPPSTPAGKPFDVPVMVVTDQKGEHIAFFHGEYSVDGGTKWTAFSYEQDLGMSEKRTAKIPSAAAGTKIMVRVRVAFRSDKGDVDVTGKGVEWETTWDKWLPPVAKTTTTLVK